MKTFADAEVQLASRLPNYERRDSQGTFARAIEGIYSQDREAEYPSHLMAQAGTGCIQGDALISINRAGIGKQITLRDLVTRFHGGRTAGQVVRWHSDIDTYVQREVDGVIRLGKISNAWASGVKQTYTVTTDSGRQVRATDEHPFLTERGWSRLDELVIGDEVHVRGTQASTNPKQPKAQYLQRQGLVGHPYAIRRDASYCSYRRPLHILVAEAGANNMKLDDYISCLRSGDGTGLTFIDPKIYAVHHIDHDHRNNNFSNLKVLTHSAHQALHCEEGKTNSVLYKVVTERVISVEPYGLEETFDIEVEDDPHNFLANGFVVHNTGKSLGYLIPAILSGQRTVVSVTTKALQSQLATKDMLFLQENLGVKFSWSMLQGRANYLCLNRCAMADLAEVPMLPEILRKAAEPGFGGTQDDLGMSIPWQAWKLICSDEDECDGDCTEMSGCFVAAARTRAISANVLIVNHALFFADLIMKGGTAPENKRSEGMLGRYDVAVFDEAHEIFSSAADAMGGQITLGALVGATGEVRTWISRYADESNNLQPVESSVTAAMGAGQDLFAKIQDGKMTPRHIMALESELGAFYQALRDLDADFSGLTYRALTGTKEGATAAKRKRSVTKRVRNLLDKVTTVIMADEHEMVRWIESRMGGRNGSTPLKTIKISPIEIGAFMRDRLLRWTPCVFVSATLSPGGSFSFMAGRFGLLPGTWTHLDVGSPFDFTTQARLYVPGHISAPNSGSWETEANEEICDLLKISRGRALVLFTSIKHMRAAMDSVSRRVPFEVRAQGDAPNGDLVNWLKASEDGVIFATRSFFTGVDIQGAALSLVILTKLPFPVPTEPLFQAQSEAIEARGGNAFGSLAVPETSLVLQQAVGRLIRHRNDVGMVAILDPRMIQKSYGRTLLKDLPPIPRADTLGDLSEWFAAEEATLMALPSS